MSQSELGEDLLSDETYNYVKRRNDVFKKLKESLREISETDYRTARNKQVPSLCKVEDVAVMFLKSIEGDITDLKNGISKYEGPHFTREYHTLQGMCSTLQSDLDSINVNGRENFRKKRKDALICIDYLAKQLAEKAHKEGKSCPKCSE